MPGASCMVEEVVGDERELPILVVAMEGKRCKAVASSSGAFQPRKDGSRAQGLSLLSARQG